MTRSKKREAKSKASLKKLLIERSLRKELKNLGIFIKRLPKFIDR